LLALLSQSEAIEEPLLHYIFELREQGVNVNLWRVALRASYLSAEFREKSFTARCSAVKRWLVASFDEVSNGHTHRAASPGQS
jgi:hypothetical protein